MTGCLLIHPSDHARGGTPGAPFVIADAMATKIGHDSLRRIVPANVSAANLHEVSRVELYRKLYIVGDGRTAFAFSGRDERIRYCLDTVTKETPNWSTLERPMGPVNAFVDSKCPDVRMVGGTLNPATLVFNWIAPLADRRETRLLGTTVAIGSGKAELERLIDEFDTADLGDVPPIARGHLFASDLAGVALAREVYSEPSDWGGYIEFAHVEDSRWTRGPSVLHYFVSLHPLEDGTYQPSFVPRVIAYNPGPGDGRILTLSEDDAGVSANEYRLKDILKPVDAAFPDTKAFWRDWKPNLVSVTATLLDTGLQRHQMYYELGEACNDAVFRLDGGAIEFGLGGKMINAAAELAGRAFRVKIKPGAWKF